MKKINKSDHFENVGANADLHLLATRGDWLAQAKLSLEHFDPLSSVYSHQAGVYWMLESCSSKGSKTSDYYSSQIQCNATAALYGMYLLLSEDDIAALPWLMKASESKHPVAMVIVASCLMFGTMGLRSDRNVAEKILLEVLELNETHDKKAYQDESINAHWKLAIIYRRPSTDLSNLDLAYSHALTVHHLTGGPAVFNLLGEILIGKDKKIEAATFLYLSACQRDAKGRDLLDSVVKDLSKEDVLKVEEAAKSWCREHLQTAKMFNVSGFDLVDPFD